MSSAKEKRARGRRRAGKARRRQRQVVPPSSDQVLAYSIPYAGSLIGLSRQSSYAAAKEGKLPTVWINGRCFVPRIPFERVFGVGAAQPAE